MKKKNLKILFSLTVVTFVLDICFLIYGLIDISNYISRISQVSSGIDYFGIGWGLGLGLFVISLIGLALSIITAKLSQQSVIKKTAYVLLCLFVVLLLLGVVIFYI
ncbi:MAG: hypothetical protein IKJ93_03170 [Clostridia bacterium]|nr:hypothetical protein [Clostridia bacterium]